MKSKNIKLLIEFAWYCLNNRDERFWQALKNWSGADEIGYGISPNDSFPLIYKDTYYFEEKTK